MNRLILAKVLRPSCCCSPSSLLLSVPRAFYGKTESHHKYKTPKLKLRSVKRIHPAPGLNLELPSDWTHEYYLKQIGGDCEEYAEKFQSLKQVFELKTEEMKKRGVPTHQRKYILRFRELHRRGLLTFEYLARRTCVDPIRE